MSTKWNPAKLLNKITIKWKFSSQGVYTHRIWTIFSSDLRDIYGFEILDLKSLKLNLCIDKLFKSDFKC
jgi:hypothetical protein